MLFRLDKLFARRYWVCVPVLFLWEPGAVFSQERNSVMEYSQLQKTRGVEHHETVATAQEVYWVSRDYTGGSDKFYITFNLPNKQLVRYELVDLSGKLVSKKDLPDTLDQTYSIESDGAGRGVYVVRLFIDKEYYASRILMN